MAWLPIKYRDFYDIPRAIIVEWRGKLYFFGCPFDNNADDYLGYLIVYQLPLELADRLDTLSWEDLAAMGEPVGKVPVSSVKLDPSKRKYIDDRIFDRL